MVNRSAPPISAAKDKPGIRKDSVEWVTILRELAQKTGFDDWRESRPPLQRRECRIHFLRSSAFRIPEVVVKTYRPGNAARRRAGDLFEKSRSLHLASSRNCSVPEHLLFEEHSNTLVMEFVDEPQVGKLLIRSLLSLTSRNQVIHRAAHWLHWFHTHSEIAPAPFDPSRTHLKMERLQRRIQDRDVEVWRRDVFLRDCMKRAARYADALSCTGLPHAVAHNDFTPFNVLVGKSKTYGFDYNADRRQPVVQDICRFLINIDNYRLLPPSDDELGTFGCRRSDHETFFRAYGDGSIPSAETWLALQFYEITRRLGWIAVQRSKRKNRLMRYVETPYLRHKARHIARILG